MTILRSQPTLKVRTQFPRNGRGSLEKLMDRRYYDFKKRQIVEEEEPALTNVTKQNSFADRPYTYGLLPSNSHVMKTDRHLFKIDRSANSIKLNPKSFLREARSQLQ